MVQSLLALGDDSVWAADVALCSLFLAGKLTAAAHDTIAVSHSVSQLPHELQHCLLPQSSDGCSVNLQLCTSQAFPLCLDGLHSWVPNCYSQLELPKVLSGQALAYGQCCPHLPAALGSACRR